MLTYIQRKYCAIFSILFYTCNSLSMLSILPDVFSKYHIQPPQEYNSIITNVQSACPYAIVGILNQLITPGGLDNNTNGIISCLYKDLGINQAFFFTLLISNLIIKIEKNHLAGDCSKIISFIHQQRKMHLRKDKNGNPDKTGNFLAAFDDAKSRFFHLPKIQKKILYHNPITQNEYAYVLKNMYLRDWSDRWSRCYVLKSFIERFHEAAIIDRSYYEFLGEAIIGAIGTFYLEMPKSSLLSTSIFFGLTSISTVYYANTNVAQIQRKYIPWKESDEILCFEDMDSIIDRTDWLE